MNSALSNNFSSKTMNVNYALLEMIFFISEELKIKKKNFIMKQLNRVIHKGGLLSHNLNFASQNAKEIQTVWDSFLIKMMKKVVFTVDLILVMVKEWEEEKQFKILHWKNQKVHNFAPKKVSSSKIE